MLIIQILLIAFAFFALTRTIRQYKQGRVPRMQLLLWLLFWFGVVFVAVLPQTTDTLAKLVGVGRGADFVTYISLLVLFYFSFRLFIKIEHVEQELTRLVRKMSLEEFDKTE